METKPLKFVAFVMTYKRPLIAKETIKKLFSQTVPPEKVLIIDNDEEESGKEMVTQLSNFPIDQGLLFFSKHVLYFKK